MERIFVGHIAGLNKAHEHVTYIRPVLGFIKQGVFPVNNGFFQCTFTDIVVERGARDFQKPGQRRPVFHHVRNGFAQT